MSPNSSISSSKAARYLAAAALSLVVGLLLVAVAAGFAIRQNAVGFGYSYLYRHQLAKVDGAQAHDTVLLGDSSLGNAIDARLWAELSGGSTVNLALTGTFGYAGSLNMLRRQLEQGHRPRLVVVMHTPEILTKKIEYEGVLASALSLEEWREIPLLKLTELLLRAEIVISMLKQAVLGAPEAERAIVDDYIAQRAPLTLEERRTKTAEKLPDLRPDAIRTKKLRYLVRLAAVCRAEKLTCLYAHGPWYDGLCASAPEYLAEANRRIAESGLTVLPGTPLCLPAEQMGDNNDHARSDLKPEVTRRYLELVSSELPQLLVRRGASAGYTVQD